MASSNSIIATYSMAFAQYAKDPSSKFHSLFEFIDNSISSYEKHTMKNDLVIIIEFGYKNNQQGEENKQQYIYIVDNAFGMNDETKKDNENYKDSLYRAIQPCDTTKESSGTQLSTYGRGMKIGLFHLSKDIEIFTKQEQKDEIYEFSLDLNKINLDSEAKKIIKKTTSCDFFNKYGFKSGTIIKLNNIYDGLITIEDYTPPNRIFDKHEIINLKQIIGWRYKQYLESGKIKIFTKMHNYEKVLVEPYDYTKYAIKKSYINSYYENSNKILTKYENDKDEIIENFLKNDDTTYHIKHKFNNKEVDVCIFYNMPFKCKSFYKDRKMIGDKISGFTLLHHKRAIKHGPNEKNKKDDNKFCIGLYDLMKIQGGVHAASGGTHWYKYLGGYIDFTNVYTPQPNKNDFNYTSDFENDRSLLATKIKKMYSKFNDMVNEIIDGENIENKTKYDYSDIDSTVNEKINESELNKNIKIPMYDGDDLKIKISSHENNDNEPSRWEYDKENKALKIVINSKYYLSKISKTKFDKSINFIIGIEIYRAIANSNGDIRLDEDNEPSSILDKILDKV